MRFVDGVNKECRMESCPRGSVVAVNAVDTGGVTVFELSERLLLACLPCDVALQVVVEVSGFVMRLANSGAVVGGCIACEL